MFDRVLDTSLRLLKIQLKNYYLSILKNTLRAKFPYSEFFWSVFSCIRTKYGPEKLISEGLLKRIRNSYDKTINMIEIVDMLTHKKICSSIKQTKDM